MKSVKRFLFFICPFIIIILLTIDQYLKFYAKRHLTGQPFIIIKGILSLTYLENRGVGFGMLQNRVTFILLINIIIMILITYMLFSLPKNKKNIILHILLSILLAGALGNVIDRIRLGYVVDFISLDIIDFPIFNFADMCVSFSIIIIALLFLFFYKNEDYEQCIAYMRKDTNRIKEHSHENPGDNL